VASQEVYLIVLPCPVADGHLHLKDDTIVGVLVNAVTQLVIHPTNKVSCWVFE
jgi:hypothetical protein